MVSQSAHNIGPTSATCKTSFKWCLLAGRRLPALMCLLEIVLSFISILCVFLGYHYQIKVAFGKISSASEQKGKLHLNLFGRPILIITNIYSYVLTGNCLEFHINVQYFQRILLSDKSGFGKISSASEQKGQLYLNLFDRPILIITNIY